MMQISDSQLFSIEIIDGFARAGFLKTSHGSVPTPAFMPVATLASVKALDPSDLLALGADIILANTYHLYLRPGVDLIKDHGGLHEFMSWPKSILTDSGGFQGFSLKHLRKLSEDGLEFKSHLDGSFHNFTPEAAVQYQRGIGADIIMPLDVCESVDSSKQEIEDSVERTFRWLERSLTVDISKEQFLFGIVQGGMHRDLRQVSAEKTTSLDFPGYSIGGLSVGEDKLDMYDITSYTTSLLPEAKPRYLMGVGSPEDLVESVARGVDMFDCVLPTRIARNGALFTSLGRINIVSSKFRDRKDPIEIGCDCYTCLNFSCAYLSHLFKTRELLGYRLATIHNLRFIMRLMSDMRHAIVEGRFQSFRSSFNDKFVAPNSLVRHEQKKKWLKSLKPS